MSSAQYWVQGSLPSAAFMRSHLVLDVTHQAQEFWKAVADLVRLSGNTYIVTFKLLDKAMVDAFDTAGLHLVVHICSYMDRTMAYEHAVVFSCFPHDH